MTEKTTAFAKLSIYDIFNTEIEKVEDFFSDLAGYSATSNMQKIDDLLKSISTTSNAALPLNATKTMTANIKYKIKDRVNTPLDMRGGDANGDALLVTAGGLTVVGGGEFPQNFF